MRALVLAQQQAQRTPLVVRHYRMLEEFGTPWQGQHTKSWKRHPLRAFVVDCFARGKYGRGFVQWLQKVGFETTFHTQPHQIGVSCGIVAAYVNTALRRTNPDEWASPARRSLVTNAVSRGALRQACDSASHWAAGNSYPSSTRFVAAPEVERLSAYLGQSLTDGVRVSLLSRELFLLQVMRDVAHGRTGVHYTVVNSDDSDKRGMHWIAIAYQILPATEHVVVDLTGMGDLIKETDMVLQKDWNK